MRIVRSRWFGLLAMFMASSACAQLTNCEIDNDALQEMPKAMVTVTRSDGSEFQVEVKAALTNRSRAAGFQRVCESTIEAMPILFVFGRPFKARFHMNNVVAPIDIAFFDESGKIDSIQAMKPYVVGGLKKPLYAALAPVIGALEGHKGFYEKHRIDDQSTLSWQLVD